MCIAKSTNPTGIQHDSHFSPSHNPLKTRMASILLGNSGEPKSQAMKIHPIPTLLGTSVIALLLASCESKQEKMREKELEQKAENLESTAGQVRKQGEQKADMKESEADAIRKSSEKAADTTEKSADTTRETTEKQADDLEKQADDVRDRK
jgi:DNA anti-recombination protein RmuC